MPPPRPPAEVRRPVGGPGSDPAGARTAGRRELTGGGAGAGARTGLPDVTRYASSSSSIAMGDGFWPLIGTMSCGQAETTT
jgi:hypothetical protein